MPGTYQSSVAVPGSAPNARYIPVLCGEAVPGSAPSARYVPEMVETELLSLLFI